MQSMRPLDPVFDTKKRTGALAVGNTPSVTPNNAPALLITMVGWWDASSYVGTGDLLNQGTTGAPLDLQRSGTTYAGGEFTFNGTSDFMACPSHSDINFNATDSFTIGVVVTQASPANADGFYMCKGILTGTNPYPGYAIWAYGTLNQPVGWIVDDGNVNSYAVNTGVQPSNQKGMFTFQRRVADDVVQLWLNGTPATPQPDTTTGTLSTIEGLTIGRAQAGATRWQAFKLHAAFIHRGVLTTAEIASIADYYGAA